MEFKYRAVDSVKPTATSHSLSDRSLQMEGAFSGLPPPYSSEAALRRALEKEQIRREILRRMELEEEVRRELEIERELGISIPRPLNIQGLLSQWLNSTAMNPVAVGHIGASQPPLILPPTEINPSSEISHKDKVIVLARPDPELYNAKRKAATLPSAFGLKKKQKEEWSCALCEIKATSESGLNAHLNGKKHKIKEARQNKKICKNKKVKATKTVDTMMIHKSENESKDKDELVESIDDNNPSVKKLKNEKKPMEMMVDKNATKCEKGELHIEKSQCLESIQDTQESGKDVRLSN
ncbi:unnamed protein product [Lathyrus oleraceus]